jgi:hypothetical protein
MYSITHKRVGISCGGTLGVFYYLVESEIWLRKRAGLVRGGLLYCGIFYRTNNRQDKDNWPWMKNNVDLT